VDLLIAEQKCSCDVKKGLWDFSRKPSLLKFQQRREQWTNQLLQFSNEKSLFATLR